MSENLVELNKFRVVKREEEDQGDLEWKQNTIEMLKMVIERVESGETTALTIMELGDDLGQYRINMYGFADCDIFTAAGLLENFKLTVLSGLHDE